MNLADEIRGLGERAQTASRELARLSSRRKNAILEAMAREVNARRDALLEANREDLEAGRAAGLSAAMLDRLELTGPRLDAVIKGLLDLVALPDPVGRKLSRWIRPNGLMIQKISVPIGVIVILYESRPNVTADASALCFKASNAVILRGGSEARHSNRALAEALQAGGKTRGLPDHSIQLVETTDREAVRHLVQLEGLVDLVIPRGGEGLIRAVTEMARVPVIKHYKGVCHMVVDASAKTGMALDLIENAKCQRPGVCNAIEKVLVHRSVAADLLPRLAKRLTARGVELRGDPESCALVPSMTPAKESDWSEEYLDLVLAVKIVPDVSAAIEHINRYGSRHSDAIVAEDKKVQEAFLREVDSAAVYVNASTRFTDGGEFGMGAEIGISTDKLHARGPMGLEELTTYKFVIRGEGQIRK
ncbi:MAG: glutamate-5-semialdehyde dehydrogenase [Kiritimatiellia bacterium]|nr:glutamate-5-semialdehyde dehydrogenase [Kiritimatiellia bacterium]